MINNLGIEIKAARLRLKLTQNKLAIKLGVSQTTVWSWEAGLSFPDGPHLIGLAQILGIQEKIFSAPAEMAESGETVCSKN